MVSRTLNTLALAASLALTAVPLVPSASAAPADDVCRRARTVLGEDFRGASAERCQQALDAADEDRWQLWLDVAMAAEMTGDQDRAALTLERFVREADRRGRLPDHWAALRDEARTNISRLDAEVLKTKARVVINSIPEGAEIEVIGTARRANPDKTPTTRYFAPGSHSVRLVLEEPAINREITFSVTVGQTLELKVDLRPNAPSEIAITESRGAPVLGQRPAADAATPTEPTKSAASSATPVPAVEPRPTPDPEDASLVRNGPGTWTRVGTVAITVGGAALAAGTVFVLQAIGLDDEAACSGLACDVDRPLRSRVRAEASVAWDRALGALIVGGALVAGGITAIVRDTPDEPSSSTTISPWFSPDGAGFSTNVRF